MAVATQALREARADHGLAEARLRTSYLELRDVCAHERVAEYRRGWEPWRICEDCGVEEHHEGTGFHVLTTDRFRRIGLGELCQLRPEVVDSLVRWCYGNRSHPPHAVFQDMEYGRMDGRPDGKPTRCCAEHALHHA